MTERAKDEVSEFDLREAIKDVLMVHTRELPDDKFGVIMPAQTMSEPDQGCYIQAWNTLRNYVNQTSAPDLKIVNDG